jgi:acyl-CoA thioesterase-1
LAKTAVAIGDSLTFGYPFSPRYSWVARAAEQIGAEIANKGFCGETTGEMLLRFDQDVTALGPDCVIILGGTNDAFMDIVSEEVRENIAAMIKLSRLNGIVPVIGLPPPVDDSGEESLLQEYRKEMRELALAEDVAVLDFYHAMVDPATGGLRRGLHNDGVHPNETGYEIMAKVAELALIGLLGQS